MFTFTNLQLKDLGKGLLVSKQEESDYKYIGYDLLFSSPHSKKQSDDEIWGL